MRAVLRRLPSPARSQTIVDGLRQGTPPLTIGKTLDRRCASNALKLINAIAEDVDAYDTFIDEVAVDRAYGGDKAVWVALTHYERRACVDRLLSRALAGLSHKGWPNLGAAGFGPELGWLGLWAEAVGENPRRYTQLLVTRRASA